MSLLGGRGALLGTASVVLRHFSSGTGGFLLLPEALLSAPGVVAIGIGSARLPLR